MADAKHPEERLRFVLKAGINKNSPVDPEIGSAYVFKAGGGGLTMGCRVVVVILLLVVGIGAGVGIGIPVGINVQKSTISPPPPPSPTPGLPPPPFPPPPPSPKRYTNTSDESGSGTTVQFSTLTAHGLDIRLFGEKSRTDADCFYDTAKTMRKPISDADGPNTECPQNYTVAMDHCESIGGYLAIIKSVADHDSIAALGKTVDKFSVGKNARIWFGLTDLNPKAYPYSSEGEVDGHWHMPHGVVSNVQRPLDTVPNADRKAAGTNLNALYGEYNIQLQWWAPGFPGTGTGLNSQSCGTMEYWDSSIPTTVLPGNDLGRQLLDGAWKSRGCAGTYAWICEIPPVV
jgi:hypothetical protein